MDKVFSLIDEEKLYTPQEIADIFGIRKETVYAWIKNRKVIAAKLGKRWLVEGKELRKLIKTNY